MRRNTPAGSGRRGEDGGARELRPRNGMGGVLRAGARADKAGRSGVDRRVFLVSLGSLVLVQCSGQRAPGRSPAAVSFDRRDGVVAVAIEGKPFTAFHYGEDWDKPFLHPVRDITGTKISRGFPLEIIEGESNDHRWHRGIIYGHGLINGFDFWREKGGHGRIVAKAPPRWSAKDGKGSIVCELALQPPEGEPIGSLREEFTFFEQGTNRIIDARITILADEGVGITMGDTEDGGFALRFRDEFREDRGATLLNSEGLIGTENIWGKRARWVDYSAVVKGRRVGAAIFDHPENPCHPTYWHARGYGLCAANPFGLRDFLGDEAQDGSMTIPPGGQAVFRYRVVIHQGDAGEADVERLYGEYAGRV